MNKDDWSELSNWEIAQIISNMKPRLWFRLWMGFKDWLYKHSYRYRRHCTIHHTTNAPRSEPAPPLTLEGMIKHVDDIKRD